MAKNTSTLQHITLTWKKKTHSDATSQAAAVWIYVHTNKLMQGYFGAKVFTILTCMIPVTNFLWEVLSSLRDYCYGGVQRTNREHHHMVQQQPPEAQPAKPRSLWWKRNRKTPVLLVMQGEEVKRVASYNYHFSQERSYACLKKHGRLKTIISTSMV